MKCRWHQIQINWHVDDDRPLPDRVLAHTETCARCGSFYREQTDVRERLKLAADEPETPSPFLKNRILNEIAREENAPAGRVNWRWIGAGAFAVLAVTLTLAMIDFNPEPEPPEFAGETLPHEWIELTARVTSGGSLFSVATNLNQPLRQEMDFVIQDTQAALNALTKEFVPSMLLAAKD